MSNRNYVKGRKKEYAIVHELREMGFVIAQRTAGSHSPVDVIGVDKEKRIIKFIQAKPDNYPKSKGDKILEDLDWLNGEFTCEFELR